MKYEGPIKCTILCEDNRKPEEVKINIEHQDGSLVSKNELPDVSDNLVDIGRDPWPYKYGLDPKIDVFTWSFKNYTKDIADRYWQQRVFSTTYRTFGFLIPKKYKFVRNPATRTHFMDEFTHDLSVFNDRPSVLAQEYLFHEKNPPGINGLGQWNDNHFFTPFGDALPAYLVDHEHYTEGETTSIGELKVLATQPMLQINMHEKTHGHGFYHDENSRESLMYPYVKPGYITRRRFYTYGTNTKGTVNKKAFINTPDDVLRLTDDGGYGKRNILLRRLNQLRARRVRGRFVPNIIYRVAV